MEKRLKEKRRQLVAKIANEIQRRSIKRKATKREKEISGELKIKAQNPLFNKEQLVTAKERWLEELRYRKVKLDKVNLKDAKIRITTCSKRKKECYTGVPKTPKKEKGTCQI